MQVLRSVCADELAGLRRAKVARSQNQQKGSRNPSRERLAASFRAEKEAVLQACLASMQTKD